VGIKRPAKGGGGDVKAEVKAGVKAEVKTEVKQEVDDMEDFGVVKAER
jgi:hypothetical protein